MSVDPSKELFSALAASGPDPAYAEQLGTFGRFVGSWDLEVTEYDKNGNSETASGEWHFGWVLGGRAVQDVWISPSRAEQAERSLPALEWGTAIRFYDPASDTWRVSWSGPRRGRQIGFVARSESDRIVLEGTEAGRPLRWVFSDIEQDRFHWAASSLREDGSWQLIQEMDVHRRTAQPDEAR